MCKTIDLHTHSYCSDGTFSPEGLVILAKKQGLSAIALTDHDTIDGLELFLEAGEKHGMETICGIEFAALYEGFHRPEIHIVGLGFDRHDPMLLEKLEENGLLPRVSEKLKNGRRTNVNIHRIMRIVWENGAEKILERRGRNS